MTWGRVAVLAAVLAACGKLPTGSDGVAFLEVTPPNTLTLSIGATVQFSARALDRAGAPLPDVVIHWRTPDVTISVGETSGVVTGVSAGTGRVQAFIEGDEFVSDFVEVTVTAAAGAAGR